ncbi:MAG: hypothetical protein AB9866_05080 [Syntrophobacteraceae bacterium]
MKDKIPSFLTQLQEPAVTSASLSRVRSSFVSRGMEYAASVLRRGFTQWETASRRGLLQGIDARVKILFLLLFIVLISVKKSILAEVAIAVFILGLTLASRINPVEHYRKILILTFIFGFLLALPAAFNIFTPGDVILNVLRFERSHTLWYFTIPQQIGITDEGLRKAHHAFPPGHELSFCLLPGARFNPVHGIR